MARSIADIGNNFGFVYQTAVDGTTITAYCPNTADAVNNFKPKGNYAAPFASARSSYGSTTIVSVNLPGSITDITINGISVIPAPIDVTGMTEADAATAVVGALNSYSPVSGPKYRATSVGGVITYFAPPQFGSTPNGYVIVISDSGGVITYTTNNFANGSDQTGVYDTVAGSRFFLNADYDGAGNPGGAPADPESLTNAIEVTKYFVMRGQQLGIFSKSMTADTNGIPDFDRSGFMTKITVVPQVGSTETIIKISPADMVEGDIVILQADTGDTVTIESAPEITVPGIGNIYLTDDAPWISSGYTALVLQYKFDATLGPIFIELSRSLSGASPFLGKTLYVSNRGNDATAVPYDLTNHYNTFDAALAVAADGDTIVVCPGAWTTTNVAGISTVENLSIYLYAGATLSGSGIFNTIKNNFVISGDGIIEATGTNLLNLDSEGNALIECKKLTLYNSTLATGGTFNIRCKESFTIVGTVEGGAAMTINGGLASAPLYMNVITPFWLLLTANPAMIYMSEGLNITGMFAGSNLKFNCTLQNIDPKTNCNLRLLCASGLMDWYLEIKGDVIDYTDYATPASYTALINFRENNYTLPNPNLNPIGFFIYGNVLTNTRPTCLKTDGGRIDLYGNIESNSTWTPEGPVTLNDGALTSQGAVVRLNNGRGISPNVPFCTYIQNFFTPGIVRMVNYVVSSNTNLITSNVAAQTCELINCISNVDVDANVTNALSTALVVDAALTP